MRPSNLPTAAVFNDADNEWELGERRGDLRVGLWTWWRPDGTLLATTPFDDAGHPHGICRRYHANGELALEATYRRGLAHGKQIATRPSSGESLENPEMATLPGVYRMDTLNIEGKPQGIATFYDLDGLTAPVAHGADGRSVALGAHLSKLMPSTAMVMVAPFFRTMTGKLPTSMVSVVRFLGLAVTGSTTYRFEVVDDIGGVSFTIADAEEVSRVLSLAVDVGAAALTPE